MCDPALLLTHRDIVLASQVSRYRPSLSSNPIFVQRFLVLTKEAILYFKSDPKQVNQAPELQIPLSAV